MILVKTYTHRTLLSFPTGRFPSFQAYILNLLHYREALERHIRLLPSGSIVQKNKKGLITYYHQYYIDGRKYQIYIRKKDLSTVRSAFSRRSLLETLLSEVRFLLHQAGQEASQIQKLFFTNRENKHRMDQLRIQCVQRTLSGFRPRERIHWTLGGEFVRSKSEALIVCLLIMLGIPYQYEQILPDGYPSFHPDFTLYLPKRVIYWEHLGLLENADYAANWADRKRLYADYGIWEGFNLLCTRDHNGHLDVPEILQALYGICGSDFPVTAKKYSPHLD